MNILLINAPSRKGSAGFTLPLGLLQVGSIVEKCGHNAKIVDPYLLDEYATKGLNIDCYDNIIEQFKPDIVGFGGIATSYGRAKEFSLYIRQRYPEIIQIAGGPLSSVYDLLLTRTKVDVVVHGEGEVSLPLLLERFEGKRSIHDVPGISYLQSGRVVRNQPAEQVKNLDENPLPAYHLIDVTKYLLDIEKWFNAYDRSLVVHGHLDGLRKTVGNKKYYISFISGRGCTHTCLFCYRHVRGIRKYSVDYVITHMKYLMKNYGVEGFQFCDEMFNASEEWVLQFCDAIKENNLNIFYRVSGARVDRINETILHRLKETGCIECEYGQESGSDTILKEYRKGVTAQKNKETLLLTRQTGLHTTVQLVIGSPSETSGTIRETIQFLKDVDAYGYSLNYLIPLPETPIWNYVKENKLITDVEKYLDQVAEHGGLWPVNLTKVPAKEWASWSRLIGRKMELHYAQKTNQFLYYYYSLFYGRELVRLFKLLISFNFKNLTFIVDTFFPSKKERLPRTNRL